MKGLLLKDLLGLKKYMRSVGFVMVLFIVLALVMKSTVYISSMMAMLFLMLPFTVFAYDESAKWDAFGLTLPITRKQVVLSRYLLVLLLFAVGLAFSLFSSWLLTLVPGIEDSFTDAMTAAIIVCSLGAVVQSVMLPIIYKVGAEKGRFVIIGIFLVILLSVFLFNQLVSLPAMNEQWLAVAFKLSPIAALILLAGSYGISAAIYEKKEI